MMTINQAPNKISRLVSCIYSENTEFLHKFPFQHK